VKAIGVGYEIGAAGERTMFASDRKTALRKAQAAANRNRKAYSVYYHYSGGVRLESYVRPEAQR